MISICIKNNNQQTINNLTENISLIKLENIIYSTKKFSKYTNIILHYTGSNCAEFYNEISSVISNCILKLYEPQIVKNIINSEYFYFDDFDIDQINSNCLETLENNYSDRKITLWTNVLKYVTENKSIILDGFVTFRLSSYLEYINSAVNSAVNQFVLDKEYYDFIDLLKSYINSTSPLSDCVHLIYSNGESILLDNNKHIIEPKEENLNLTYLSDISFSSNDYTLNTLLTLLPSKIFIHSIAPEDEFINTLKLIFENRIKLCNDLNGPITGGLFFVPS